MTQTTPLGTAFPGGVTAGSGPGGVASLASLAGLTRREREVLALIAAGWSNEGIREALYLSPKTVESHVHSIFLKLGLPRGSQMHPRVLATRVWMSAQSSLPVMEVVQRAA